jgi:hypothetical protein
MEVRTGWQPVLQAYFQRRDVTCQVLMAFAVKIRGVPVRGDRPGWMIDNVIWWDIRELRAKYPNRKIVDETLYLDYVLVLTPAEAMCWHRHFKDVSEIGTSFCSADWVKRIEELGSTLETTQASLRWVIVEQYEWESGY